MEQIPPPQLPWHRPDLPAAPTVIPRLPTRVQQPGRQAPLPDAVAVWPCVVPATAPPFDDEGREDVNLVAEGRPYRDKFVPGEAVGGRAVHDLAVPHAADPDPGTADPGTADASETDRGRPGPAGGWPSQFAQVLAETLAGARPAHQLTPWTTEQARKRIRQLGPMLATDQRPKVRRVMTSAPATNVLELTAVVGFGPRVRILAMRLEREQARAYRQGDSRWRCTAIESA